MLYCTVEFFSSHPALDADWATRVLHAAAAAQGASLAMHCVMTDDVAGGDSPRCPSCEAQVFPNPTSSGG